jgi:HAD superfamily hydrolase (TIGR01458 family)
MGQMDNFPKIKGLLFDLDGVLYVGSRVIEGAIDAVERIQASDISCRFVTNTSTLSLESLQHKINSLGFSIPKRELISAPQAALLFLTKQPNPVCRFLLSDDVKQDFTQFQQSDTEAKYIIIGDIGEAWSYRLINEVFNCIMKGAQLIAIHKNRFWQTEQGLQMDIGGFVEALEYASNTKAKIIGKPSFDFFNIALGTMGFQPADVAIIGDDIDTDVGGGQQVGLKGILVKTGKYRQSYVDSSPIKPTVVIDSIKELPDILKI